jgi:hypothetical protein
MASQGARDRSIRSTAIFLHPVKIPIPELGLGKRIDAMDAHRLCETAGAHRHANDSLGPIIGRIRTQLDGTSGGRIETSHPAQHCLRLIVVPRELRKAGTPRQSHCTSGVQPSPINIGSGTGKGRAAA